MYKIEMDVQVKGKCNRSYLLQLLFGETFWETEMKPFK